MRLICHELSLTLKHPFTIARGTITHQDSLIVELEHDGLVGYGEVTANAFYGHSVPELSCRLEEVPGDALEPYMVEPPEANWARLAGLLDGNMFALSALDMAAHDWWGQRLQKPTWQGWGEPWNGGLVSSFTIGLDTIPVMLRKLAEEPGWTAYKIKLGGSNDLETMRAIRQATDAQLRVDANGGWSAEQTIEMSVALAELGVQFIEQPLPREASTVDKRLVYERSALPLIADEDCQTRFDLDACFRCYHGINVKLCKCGGISPAVEMLRAARAAGKRTMIGCMIESSIGISGALQLGPLLDYADLDGAHLTTGSNTSGAIVTPGFLQPPTAPGTGARLLPASPSR